MGLANQGPALAKPKANGRESGASRLGNFHLQVSTAQFPHPMDLHIFGTEHWIREVPTWMS